MLLNLRPSRIIRKFNFYVTVRTLAAVLVEVLPQFPNTAVTFLVTMSLPFP